MLAYSIPKAAKMLSLGRSTIYELVKRGDGPKITKLGGRSVIFADDLRAWADAKRETAGKAVAP